MPCIANAVNHFSISKYFSLGRYTGKDVWAFGKDVFWEFMDLEKVYDTIDRHGMWQMLRLCGVGGKLLKAVQSFYKDSRACVRVGNDVSK